MTQKPDKENISKNHSEIKFKQVKKINKVVKKREDFNGETGSSTAFSEKKLKTLDKKTSNKKKTGICFNIDTAKHRVQQQRFDSASLLQSQNPSEKALSTRHGYHMNNRQVGIFNTDLSDVDTSRHID